jgi:peptidyl-prolyl cis-trans isomerase B (cyclophilin B)
MTFSARRLFPSHLAAVLLAGSVGVLGCGQKSPPESDHAQTNSPIIAAKPETPPASKPADPEPAAKAAPVQRDRLHQAFGDATRAADNPPGDANRPPDTTVTNKPVFKILEAVGQTWDSIRFVSPAGKKIHYTADIDTSMGQIRLVLFPEQAPNHVRNFIALARAGYYDQLFFDRVRREQGEGQSFESVEAGCPLGTGEPGNGSIGYWLKDELTPGDKMSHEEGTVGACRGNEADTAACRFYITLSKAPFLDGNDTIFGKVVQGLDVARRISLQPVIVDDQNIDGARRPEKPIVIQKVTIHETEE